VAQSVQNIKESFKEEEQAKPTLLNDDKDLKDFEIKNKQQFSTKELLDSEISKAKQLMAQSVQDIEELFQEEELSISTYIQQTLEEYYSNDFILANNAQAIVDQAVSMEVDFEDPTITLTIGGLIYDFQLVNSMVEGEIKITFDFELLVNISFDDLHTASWDEGACVMAYPEIGKAHFEGKGEWTIPLESIPLEDIQNKDVSLLDLMKSNSANITSFSLFEWETQTDPSFFE
jgi:hypothetical protein